MSLETFFRFFVTNSPFYIDTLKSDIHISLGYSKKKTDVDVKKSV